MYISDYPEKFRDPGTNRKIGVHSKSSRNEVHEENRSCNLFQNAAEFNIIINKNKKCMVRYGENKFSLD